jgi:succinate-acetate transporter protein
MGWRGAGGGGAATIGTYYFFGGMLQVLGAILEWIIGNTFIYIVFGSFGAFWLTFAATLTPFYAASSSFTADATTTAEKEFMYLICSLRTNVVFFIIFLLLDISLFLLTASYWKGAEGNAAAAATLQKVSYIRHLCDNDGCWNVC